MSSAVAVSLSSLSRSCTSSSSSSTLSRQFLQSSTTTNQFRQFSSTVPREAVVKKKAAPAKKKSTVKKKNGPSGPRSAGGKRKGGSGSSTLSISASSPPADLSSLPTFSPENAIDSNVFKPMALGNKIKTALKECGSPNGVGKVLASQNRPWLLLRPQTLSVLSHLDSLASSSSPSSTSRSSLLPFIPGGGSGSSSLLLQSVSYALDSSWAVVYLPRSRSLVDGSSSYIYSAPLKSYLQPTRSKEILSWILSINGSVLKSIDLPQGMDLPNGLAMTSTSQGTKLNLETLIKNGLNGNLSPLQSFTHLDLCLRVLANQTKVPYLLAVDEFQSLFQESRYKDPDYKTLNPQDLAIPRLIRGALAKDGALESKDSNLPSLKIQRGTALSALSYSDDLFPVRNSILLAIERAGKGGFGGGGLVPNQVRLNLYDKDHSKSQAIAAGMKGGLPGVLDLSKIEKKKMEGESREVGKKDLGISTREAKELWRMRRWEMGYPGYVELANGLTENETGSDEQFLSKFIETGGNMREFHSALGRSVM